MKRGIFITLEGADGCGKSTQAPGLARFLRSFGRPVIHTREPGGSPFAENLRRIILDPNMEIEPMAELMLYEAARAQHTAAILAPALKKGALVLCERYVDATVAYQGYGRRLDLKMISKLNALATQGLMPRLTLVLDIPLAESLKRCNKREGGRDRMEKAAGGLQARVIGAYRKLARQNPKRVRLISGLGSTGEVGERLQRCVGEFLRPLISQKYRGR